MNQVLEQTNVRYSLADLRSEWSVVHMVSCMLTALKDEGNIVSTTDCQQMPGGSMDDVVVVLTTHQTDFDGLVATPQAKCQPSVTFSGSTWTFPHTGSSAEVKSEQYVRTEPWTEAYSQTDAAPFQMS